MWPFKKKPAAALSLAPPAPLPVEAPRAGIIATNMPRADAYIAHPGWGLTAERIRIAFQAAENGYPASQCDVFDDAIERDGHTRSLIESRLVAVAGKQWILQAGGDDVADAQAAHDLEMRLRDGVEDISATWEHQLMSLFYGWSGTELDWDRVDGLTVPVHFANVPHRRFRFLRGTDEPRLLTEQNLTEGDPLQPGKWMFSRRRGRITARAGLMRTVIWWAWLKSLSVRDWQIFCARFGLPFVTGFYPETANEETIDKLKAAILAFGQNGGAALVEGSRIEIKEPASMASGSGASVHPGLVQLCNQEISKIISGATLTSGEGSSVGSYALGQVHQDQSFNLTMGDAELLASWFQNAVGRPFIKFNGLKARPPRLKLRVVREVNPLTRMQITSIAANELGMQIDETQVREEHDLKAPPPGGKALVGTAKPPVGAAGATFPSMAMAMRRTPEEWAEMNRAADAYLERSGKLFETLAAGFARASAPIPDDAPESK